MAPLTDRQRRFAADNVALTYAIIRRSYVIKGNPRFDMDDAIQAGMEGLLRAVRGYDPEQGTFGTYGALCIKTYARRQVRRNRSSWTVSVNSNELPASFPLDAAISDESDSSTLGEINTGTCDDTTGIECREFLQTLTERERTVLRMRMANRRHREIGAVLGVSHTTVGQLLHRIRTKWRAWEGEQ